MNSILLRLVWMAILLGLLIGFSSSKVDFVYRAF